MTGPRGLIRHSPAKAYERDDDWRQRGACAHDPNPDAWAPEATSAEAAYAVDTCWNVCPVQSECDAFARRIRPDGGVWAGIRIPDRSHGKRKDTDA